MTVTINGSSGISSPGGDTSTSLSTGLLTVTGSTVPANGMYLPTTNTLAWATNSTERMRLDSSGNLGIGTTSPSVRLHVIGDSIRFSTSSNASYYGSITHDSTTTGANIYNSQDSGGHIWQTSGTERARIDSSGNLLVGATSNSGVRLYVKGASATSADWSIYAVNSAGTTQFGLRNDNYFYAPSIGGYGTAGTAVVVNGNYLGYLSSSLRFKKDVVDYDKGLLEILSLRPVYYKSKNPNPDGEYDEQRYAGLIAEEIAELGFSEFVLNGPDGQINSIQYGNMVALCIKAIQELTARLEASEGAK